MVWGAEGSQFPLRLEQGRGPSGRSLPYPIAGTKPIPLLGSLKLCFEDSSSDSQVHPYSANLNLKHVTAMLRWALQQGRGLVLVLCLRDTFSWQYLVDLSLQKQCVSGRGRSRLSEPITAPASKKKKKVFVFLFLHVIPVINFRGKQNQSSEQ